MNELDFESLNKMILAEQGKSSPISIDQAVDLIKKSVDLTFLVEESGKLCVETLENARKAVEMANQSRKIKNRLDVTKTAILRPHIDFHSAINRVVMEVEAELMKIETNLKEKISQFLHNKDSMALELISKIDTDEGSMYVSKEWIFQITDESKLPREFLKADEKLIKEHIKNGIRELEGVKIFEIEKISFRIKNSNEVAYAK